MNRRLVLLGILVHCLVIPVGCSFIKDLLKDKPVTIAIGADTTSTTHSSATSSR